MTRHTVARSWNPFSSTPSSADTSRDRQPTLIPTIEDHFPRMRYQPREMSQTNGRLNDINMSGQSESHVVVSSVLDSLERDKHDLELDLRDMTDYCHKLQAKLDAANAALKTSWDEATQYKDDMSDLKQSREQCEKHHVRKLNKLTTDLEEAKREGSEGKAAIQATLNHTGVRLEETTRECTTLKGEFSALQLKHLQMLDLLQVRSDELREAEYFLNKRDNFSDDEAILIVEDINATVSSIAMEVAQSFGPNLSNRRNELSVKTFSDSVGKRLLSDLKSFNHRHDTSLVEWAVRSEISYQIYDVFTDWDAQDIKLGQKIQQIHEKMFQEEPQTISARWRTLTFRYNASQTHEERVSSRVASSVCSIAQILFISGAPTELTHLEAQCMEYYGTLLGELWNATYRAVDKFRENVISSDYSVEIVTAEDPFNPNQMKPQGVGSTKAPSAVDSCAVCTAALGLRRVRHIDGRGGDDRGKVEEMFILKPEIVLPSDVIHVRQSYKLALAAITPLPPPLEPTRREGPVNQHVFEPRNMQLDPAQSGIAISVPLVSALPPGANSGTTPKPSQESHRASSTDRRLTQNATAPESASTPRGSGSRVDHGKTTKSPAGNKTSVQPSTSQSQPPTSFKPKSSQTSTGATTAHIIAKSATSRTSGTSGPRDRKQSLQSGSTNNTTSSALPVSASESEARRQGATKVGDLNQPVDGNGAHHDGAGKFKEDFEQRPETSVAEKMEVDLI